MRAATRVRVRKEGTVIRARSLRRTRWLPAVLALAAASGCAVPVTISDSQSDHQQTRYAESRRNLGIDHLGNGRLALAIRELTHAEVLGPGDSETQLWLGEALRRKGLFEEAEAHVLRALELRKDYHAARVNLSALYIQMERYPDSIAQSRILIEDPTYPTPWRSYTNLGWAQFKQGRLLEARASLAQALDFHPTFWQALLNMGILEQVEGHTLRALDRFQEVLDSRPGRLARAEVNYRMGEILVALGRRESALQHFSAAVQRAPHARWGKDSKRYLALLR